MPRRKAFLDTTILVDAVFKPTGEGNVARRAIAAFEESVVPQYAIKEFKAGALRNYIWLHAKAATLRTFDEVIDALTKMWARRNLSATALRALRDFEQSISAQLPSELLAKYGDKPIGEVRRAELEVWLKGFIFRAWRKRRKIATAVQPLACYREVDIFVQEGSGIISAEPVRCKVDDCCLRDSLRHRASDLDKMLAIFDQLPRKPETGKRKEALKHLRRTPNRPLIEKHCIALGDAVFVLQCPTDAVLLTTNLADHAPLARALGKTVMKPGDVTND